jgi:hypothetical protein
VTVRGTYDNYFKMPDVSGISGDSLFGVNFTDRRLKIEVEFSLVLDAQTQEVISAQIDEIEGEIGRAILNPHPAR